jgi:hypothetical protein
VAKVSMSREELAHLLLQEAWQSGKCIELADVFITGPHAERTVTWGYGTRSATRSVVSTQCVQELQAIASRLQAIFDLRGEDRIPPIREEALPPS